MTKEVEIEALKPFNRTPQGDLCDVGDVFEVAATRADQLEASGLARRIAVAPTPENKMAPEPAAKAEKPGRKPLAVAPKD